MADGSTLRLNAFVNHQVDCALLSQCGQFLAHRFKHAGLQITKIVAPRSGVILGQAIALNLQLPLIVATTQRPLTSAPDKEIISQKRLSGGVYPDDQTLYISAEFLRSGDRVLLVDDVLASGGMAAALGDLVGQCGATVAGHGFLIEKSFMQGRSKLPPDVIVEPVVTVKSISGGNIEFLQEGNTTKWPDATPCS